jgi:hypothetical protein
MIGRTDIVFPTKAGVVGLDCCLRIARSLWPNAVFEDARAEGAPSRYADLCFDGLNEVFVFRDAAVAAEWEAKGAGPALANTMIHLLCSAQTITVVVDDPRQSEMAEYLVAVHAELPAWDVIERIAA